MTQAISAVRANQKSALGLSGGLFNGVLSIVAIVADVKRLTFNANITYQTGDVGNPSETFTPCNDDGEVRKFANLDDIIKWAQGAFVGFTSLSINIDDAGALAKVFNPPLDPIADAVKQKVAYQKLKDGIQDNKTAALAKVAAAEASGWDESTAHPALQANYALIVAKKDAVVAIEAYYIEQIANYTAIANS